MASFSIDQELRKAFQDLQVKAVSTKSQIEVADAQVKTLKREIQHAALVGQEITMLPPETRTFEANGKLFILQSQSAVKEHLKTKVTESEEKIRTFETNKAYLEKSLKESEDSLRELVMSRQKQS